MDRISGLISLAIILCILLFNAIGSKRFGATAYEQDRAGLMQLSHGQIAQFIRRKIAQAKGQVLHKEALLDAIAARKP
jgi:hypothetical protein